MEGKPVWCVKTVVPFSLFDNQACTPLLRLVLVPNADFPSAISSKGKTLHDFKSTVNHFFDNIAIDLKNPRGHFEHVELCFLLEDRSLLKSHSGIVIDHEFGMPLFIIGPFLKRRHQVELFRRPYPWAWKNPTSEAAAESFGKPLVIGESCQESEEGYTISFKVHSLRTSKAPSGMLHTIFYQVSFMYSKAL